MAVEIAKESSDMCLPLKAVMGALPVLIKNHDVSPPQHPVTFIDHLLQQSAANAEQIKDIEERIQSLSGVLASPVGDRDSEEKARRETLRRFVLSFRETLACLHPVDYSQEVGWDYLKTQTALRTARACEVLEERRPRRHIKRFRTRTSLCRHGLPSMHPSLYLANCLTFWVDIDTAKHLREHQDDRRQHKEDWQYNRENRHENRRDSGED
jgi:hypothetical protein